MYVVEESEREGDALHKATAFKQNQRMKSIPKLFEGWVALYLRRAAANLAPADFADEWAEYDGVEDDLRRCEMCVSGGGGKGV